MLKPKFWLVSVVVGVSAALCAATCSANADDVVPAETAQASQVETTTNVVPADLKKGCYSQRNCKGKWLRFNSKQQCLSMAPNNSWYDGSSCFSR